MSWKDALGGLLFEQDTKTAAKETVQSPVPPKGPAATASVVPRMVTQMEPSSLTNTGIIPDAGLCQGYMEKLRSKLSAAESWSILEAFNVTLESLSEAIPDEGNRYRTALKLLGKQSGIDSAKMNAAYQSLVAILDTEGDKFVKSIEGQNAKEVTGREQQVTSLNDQIQGLIAQRDQLVLTIGEQKTKLHLASISFENAQAALRSEINDSTNKLRIYLPQVTTMAK